MIRRKMTKLSDGGITMVTCLMAICLSVLTLTEAADEVFRCDFETSTRPPCSIVEDQTDDFNWDIGSGPTNSKSTGPDADHTIGDATGQYFYIEVSGRTPGARATFDTPELQHAGPFCLTMWRSMFGHHIGTLTVYEVTDNGPIQKASWSHTENTNAWIQNRVEISSGTKKVRISATNGATTSGQPHGDIAVDDLVVTVGSCAATTTTSSTMHSTTTSEEEMLTTEAETTAEETTTMEPTTTEPIETTEVPTTAQETTEATTQITSTEESVESTVITEPDTSTQSETSEATTTVTDEVSYTSSPATSAFTTSSESPTEDSLSTKVTSTARAVSSTHPDGGTTTHPGSGTTTYPGSETTLGAGEADEALNVALVGGIAAAASVILLVAIIALVVLVRRRNRKKSPPSGKGKSDNESFDTDRDGTKVTGLSDTSQTNESSTDHIYNQIYSSLEGPTKPKPDSKPSPPLPKRNLPAPPTRPLPSPNEEPPPTLPRPNHTLPDLEPPRDLAPIPPMKNPLAGLDISPLQDEPVDSGWNSPPPPQSPIRHKKRRQRHRHREDEDDRRHHHRRRHRQHSNDDWDHPGSAHFSRTHDPRAKRKTLDVPVSPDYIPLTMGAVPMQMDPTTVSNGYYGQDPYSPQPHQGNWNWTTIPRPRVFY